MTVKNLRLIFALATLSPISMLASINAASAADTAATATATAATPVVGKMLYSADGKKLAAVYRLDASGAPQVLLEGKLVTIPASSLTEVDGRITTSLTKKDIFTR
jgi:hypothetical protein